MRLVNWIRAVTCVGVISAALEVNADEDIATDRPDFTETSWSIPRGKLQIETGATYDEAGGVSGKRGPELLIRFGVLPRTEARIGYNHSWESADGQGENSGLYHVGAKFQFAPDGAVWGASVIPTLAWADVETGFENTSADAAFGLIFTWERDLNERWGLGGVVGPVWDEIDGEGDDTVFATFVVGTDLDPRVGTFLEWVADIPQGSGEAAQSLHHGYTYLLAPNARMDIHGGIGLTDAARDWFIGVGLAYRAPK